VVVWYRYNTELQDYRGSVNVQGYRCSTGYSGTDLIQGYRSSTGVQV
jgi:hypothetical protein